MLNKERFPSNWLLDIWVKQELIKNKSLASHLACDFYSGEHLHGTQLSFLTCVTVIRTPEVLSKLKKKVNIFVLLPWGLWNDTPAGSSVDPRDIKQAEEKSLNLKCKIWGRWISRFFIPMDPPTCFNYASFPFSCRNHSLHVVRIILQITECQKWCKLHCPSISDTHILLINVGYEDNYPWLQASRSTV